MIVTIQYLREHPEYIFVFGDNLLRKGHGGAAMMRDEPNTWGFITKKYPSLDPRAYYKPAEYLPIFEQELDILEQIITGAPGRTFLITKLGAGLANKFGIFEEVIEPKIKQVLGKYSNVKFLW